MQIFVDCDGVLADFDSYYEKVFGNKVNINTGNIGDVDWDLVDKHKDFFLNLQPMPDMQQLWNYVSFYKPIIITGTPYSVKDAEKNKREWISRWLGSHVPVITCASKDKCLHGKPGDILIDDWTKYQQKWIDMGGIWITHTNAKSTIWQLQNMGL